jgi:colicin import membrane protein
MSDPIDEQMAALQKQLQDLAEQKKKVEEEKKREEEARKKAEEERRRKAEEERKRKAAEERKRQEEEKKQEQERIWAARKRLDDDTTAAELRAMADVREKSGKARDPGTTRVCELCAKKGWDCIWPEQ